MYADAVRVFREKFINAVDELVDDQTPVFFSAGTDSICVLAAMMELGYERPQLYHLCVEGWPSDEVNRAAEMTARWNLNYQMVVVPRADLERDVREVISWLAPLRKYNPARSTVAQVAHMMLYLARAARADGFDRAATGIGGVMDDTRIAAEAYFHGGDEGADPRRRWTIMQGELPMEEEVTPINMEIWLAGQLGVELYRPFEQIPDFTEWLLAQPWRVVNYPRLKGLGVRAFEWFWKGNEHWYRGCTNMHIGCGMREFHAELASSTLNSRGVSKPVGVYHDLTREARTGANAHG